MSTLLRAYFFLQTAWKWHRNDFYNKAYAPGSTWHIQLPEQNKRSLVFDWLKLSFAYYVFHFVFYKNHVLNFDGAVRNKWPTGAKMSVNTPLTCQLSLFFRACVNVWQWPRIPLQFRLGPGSERDLKCDIHFQFSLTNCYFDFISIGL